MFGGAPREKPNAGGEPNAKRSAPFSRRILCRIPPDLPRPAPTEPEKRMTMSHFRKKNSPPASEPGLLVARSRCSYRRGPDTEIERADWGVGVGEALSISSPWRGVFRGFRSAGWGMTGQGGRN